MKISPCPFCGSDAVLCDNKYPNELFCVFCKECECMTPLFITPEEALEVWNRREPFKK